MLVSMSGQPPNDHNLWFLSHVTRHTRRGVTCTIMIIIVSAQRTWVCGSTHSNWPAVTVAQPLSGSHKSHCKATGSCCTKESLVSQS
jgi:hypothetical protein